MKYRVVALYKNERGVYEDLTITIGGYTKDDDILHKLREIEDLANMNYIVDSCIITTDENLYFKKALEASVIVLKSTVETYKEYLDGLKEKYGEDDDVVIETRRLQEDYEKTQMRKVALRCSRCLNRDIDVTDELALQCYDLHIIKGEI